MTMTLEEFQKQSRRTMPFGGKPNSQQSEDFLLNYSLGIVGEAIELSKAVAEVNSKSYETSADARLEVLKEAGDVLHYVAGLHELNAIEMKLWSRIGTDVCNYEHRAATSIVLLAGEIAEFTKKHVFHGHDAPFPLIVIRKLIAEIARLSHVFNSSIEDVMQLNIDKLRTRYPDNFSTEDSVARVDVNE